MPGVRNVKVNFEAKEAYVSFEPAKATIDDMVKALAKAGYQGRFKRDGRP